MIPVPSIVPALDVKIREARGIVRNLKAEPSISWYKVGSRLVNEKGLKQVCQTLRDEHHHIRLILDPQKGGTDIPSIVESQVIDAKEYGVDAFIAAPLGSGSSPDPEGSLERFVSVCRNQEMIPIVLLEMTHPGSDFFLKRNAHSLLTRKAIDLGVPYVIVPGNRPRRLGYYSRLLRGTKIQMMSPGVGIQATGRTESDAARAVRLGVDHIIIGRGIYQNIDPKATVREIHREMLNSMRIRRKGLSEE